MEVNMRNYVISFILLIVVISCTTMRQPEILKFEADRMEVKPNETVTLIWNVANADNVEITGLGSNLPASGSISITMSETSTFTLRATKGKDLVAEKNIKVLVKSEPKPESKPKGKPVEEKKNTTQSKYVKGLINPESVKPESNLYLNIHLIDSKDYPKKVKVYCTVVDDHGNQIVNLAPPYNYAYVDNWKGITEIIAGKEYKVEKFDVEEVRYNDAPPYSVLFVLDYSGSMAEDISFLENAYYLGIKYLKPGKDDFSVVQFDHRIENPILGSMNYGDANRILSLSDLGGATAFYDASIIGMEQIANSKKEKVAILFTDGMDNSSFYDVNDLVYIARKNDIKVFVIGFNRPFCGFYPYVLGALAEMTGGKAYFPSLVAELPDIFAEIFQVINLRYVLSFEAIKSKEPMHTLQIALDFPYGNKTLVAKKNHYVEPLKIDEQQAHKKLIVAFFESGKSELDKPSKENLKKVADYFKKNPNKKIGLVGHSDTRGSDALNMTLSKRRAKAVYDMLVKLGVDRKQIIQVEGKGKKEPIYPNETEEYQFRENLRVELIFL